MQLRFDEKRLKNNSAKLTDQEMRWAFALWHKDYPYKASDKEQEHLLKMEVKKKNWLAESRNAQFISLEDAAKKLNISRQAYSRLEKNEQDGTITLSKLVQAAEAIDCELVYFIRPKQKILFAELIWSKILPIALRDGWLTVCDQKKKGNALAAVAKRLMKTPEFRDYVGWSKRQKKAEK